MGTVTAIEEFMPHVIIATADRNVHVIPCVALERVVSGSLPPSNLGDDVLRAIIAEWMEGMV